MTVPQETGPDMNSTTAILARMEVKLDSALTGISDHETRIRALEQARWKLAGFAAGVGAVTGAGVTAVTKILGG